MSEFAFFRFMSLNLLTQDEKVNKNEIISITEEVLDAKGIECDSKIVNPLKRRYVRFSMR